MFDRREFLMLSGSALLPRGQRNGIHLLAPENALAEESWRGYRRCLDFTSYRRLVVVPGFRALSNEQWLALRTEAGEGAQVILESGLAFASDPEIDSQRDGLWRHFGIRIDRDLSRSAGVRYVRYHWPVNVLVRDFGQAVRVQGEGIASTGGEVIAVRKPYGRGSVIYLGSPLGPQLLANDGEAQEWLLAATRIR